MDGARTTTDVPDKPADPVPRIPALDLLIEHEREVCKLSEAKRERADAVSLALITAATALGAVLVTAAKSLQEDQVPKLAAWGVLLALGLTIVTGVLTRATALHVRLRSKARSLRSQHDNARQQVRDARVAAGSVDDAEGMVHLQQAILRIWTTRTTVNEDSTRLKHLRFAVTSGLLLIAVALLGWIAISVLVNIW
jgi:hypothetical protein